MKYLLIKNLSYEGDACYSFESDKSLEELNADFLAIFNSTPKNESIEFCGRKIYNSGYDLKDYEILTLDSFWDRWNND